MKWNIIFWKLAQRQMGIRSAGKKNRVVLLFPSLGIAILMDPEVEGGGNKGG